MTGNGGWIKASGGFEAEGPSEAQLDSLFNLAVDPYIYGINPYDVIPASTIGSGTDKAARVVIIATDAPFHQAGDGVKWGLTLLPHDGINYRGGYYNFYEEPDYVSIPHLRNALRAANILPIFAVTASVQSTYQDLVKQLGFGAVVPLSSNPNQIAHEISQVMDSDRIALVRNATIADVQAGLRWI